MGDVIAFPNSDERDWRELEERLRERFKGMPDGIPTLEECLPIIRQRWQEIFVSYSIQPSINLPSSLTSEQLLAVDAAIGECVHLMAKRISSERAKLFYLLINAEWESAYLRRNGTVL